MTLRDIIYNKNLSRDELLKEVHSYLKDYGEVDAKKNERDGRYQSNDYYLDGFNSRLRVGQNIDNDGYRKMVINELLDTLMIRGFNYNTFDDGDFHDEYDIYMADLMANKVNAGYKYYSVSDDDGVVSRVENVIRDDGRSDMKEQYYVKENNNNNSKYLEINRDEYLSNRDKLKITDKVLSIDEFNEIVKGPKPVFNKTPDTQTGDNPSLDTQAIVKGASDLSSSLISNVPKNTNNASNVEKDEGKKPGIISSGELGLNHTAVSGIKQKSTPFGLPISKNPVIPGDIKLEQPVMLPEVGIVAKYAPETSFNIARRIGEDAISNGALKSSVKPQSSDVVEPANVQKPVDTKVQAEPLIMSPNGVMPGAVASRGGLINGNVVSSNQSNSRVGMQIPAAVASRFNAQQSTPPNQPTMLPGATVTATKESPVTMLPDVTVTPSTTQQSLSIAHRVAEQALPKMNLEGSKVKPPKIVGSPNLIESATRAANTINLVNAGVGLATGIYGMNQVNKMKAPMPLTAPTLTAEKVRDRGAQIMAATKGNIESQTSSVRNSLYRSGRQELLPSTIAPGVAALNQASASVEQLRTDIDKINTAAENRVNEVNAANKYQIGSFNQQVGLSFQQMKSSLSNQVLSSAGQNISANLNGIVQNKFGSAMYQQGTLQRQREMYQQMLLSGDPETRMYAKSELKKLKANGTV